MSQDWSRKEVTLIVEDYFDMLRKELQGTAFNKTAHRIALLPRLKDRSNGSVEFKHQNISAILVRAGQPFIKGYKPMANFQNILEEEVMSVLQHQEALLRRLFEEFVDQTQPETSFSAIDFKSCLEEGPEMSFKSKKGEPRFKTFSVNYLEREQNNRKLGIQGEQFVVGYEKWRLRHTGRSDLIGKIEWVSKDKGDGAGFDILSRNTNGSERFIEVKTTKLSKECPIFVSANEISFAASHADSFYLYRVFNFGEQNKLFIRQGNFDGFCVLSPTAFKGVF